MTVKAAVLCLLVMAGMVISACGGGEIEPPESTLSYEGQDQIGGQGSYCWSEDDWLWFDSATCVDMIGIPVPDETLVAPSGAALVFRFAGDTAPSEVHVTAHPLIGEIERTAGMDWLDSVDPAAPELPVVLPDGQAEIIADLPPGEYVIAVAVWIPRGAFETASGNRAQATNSVSYGFHVVVE